MRDLPLLAPKNHALVSKEVRNQSLASMTGVPQCEDPAEKAKLLAQTVEDDPVWLNQPADPEDTTSVLKKRKLYRQASGQEAQ